MLERSSGKIRLRANEPRKRQSDRFAHIFAPLKIWVSKNAKIIIDNSVDKEKLKAMGFPHVVRGVPHKDSNAKVMEYLKKVVPKMFQVR